jgi:RNA polymerase sigma-70 factor (ECF subfamily)
MPCNRDTDSLVNIHGLYSYAVILTRNHAEAEDLIQETYVRAIPAMMRLRAGSNMKGWLHYPEKCLPQPVEKAAQWSSNDRD